MIYAIIGGVLLLGGILVGPVMSNVEIPNYEVIQTNGNIEIRQYQPMIVAEVEITGERQDAASDGFRLLADYIFGNNTVQQDIAMTAPVQQQQSQKIAMTAPVQQQKSQKIAMTAPVQQQLQGESWTVNFVMPSEFNMNDLPEPNNDQVKLKEISAKTFVAIRFPGTSSDANVSKHEQQLMDFIQLNEMTIVDSPKYAFYDPPWTIPPLRRNEVMIEIEQ